MKMMESITLTASPNSAEDQTNVLLKVQLAPITNDKCSSYYGKGNRMLRNGLMDHQLCAGDEEMDTCPVSHCFDSLPAKPFQFMSLTTSGRLRRATACKTFQRMEVNSIPGRSDFVWESLWRINAGCVCKGLEVWWLDHWNTSTSRRNGHTFQVWTDGLCKSLS